ncbi:unnamed protein product [Amoebophrya sp. A25]|nr:unnamed protein product [Amoebophrya sp. A25]|eukprot:GSA25T00002513001.1
MFVASSVARSGAGSLGRLQRGAALQPAARSISTYFQPASDMGVSSSSGLMSSSSSSSCSLFNKSSLFQQKRQYHEAVIDHFQKPRNVGKLDGTKKNVGSALVGKASCGDVIKLQIEVDETSGKIKDAKFKTFGCGSAIASSSLATEMIINKSLDEAKKLSNTDISSELNLPPVKIHCSVLAEEAIQAAIEDYKKKQGGGDGASAKSAAA